MSSILIVLTGFTFFYFGYKFYSKFVATKIFNIYDSSFITPSKEMQDGVDYLPTKKHILFGHHFTSIAGAAPIIGPCVAAYWGWLPALIWILFGTVFMGAVHDFGALVVSVKEKGRSIADVASSTVSRRVRLMFLIFILMLVWLVLAVFAMVIADLFVSNPEAVIPINVQILVAIAIGFLMYKKNVKIITPSIIAVFLLYFFMAVGTYFPVSINEPIFGLSSRNFWIIALFIYSSIASLLPVWMLLQPRDYINSHQLFIGLGLLFLGVFVAQPLVEAPAIRSLEDELTPSIFPLLFVTIACGAISGFHGLVSSGTSSKQLENIQDARMVGYGGMIGEGSLALFSTIAAVAGISLVTQSDIPHFHVAEFVHNKSNWELYYDTWEHARGNKALAFVLGGSELLQSLGIPKQFASTLMSVLVISFAATTLDTATRIQRFIINEFGQSLKIKSFSNKYIATLIAVLPAIFLAFWDVPDPASSADSTRSAGFVLWPIFGASNQMLAALTLMVISIYFLKRKKNVLPLVIPMFIVLIITFVSLLQKSIYEFGNNNVLFFISLLLLVLIIWMVIEGVIKVLEIKKSM